MIQLEVNSVRPLQYKMQGQTSAEEISLNLFTNSKFVKIKSLGAGYLRNNTNILSEYYTKCAIKLNVQC